MAKRGAVGQEAAARRLDSLRRLMAEADLDAFVILDRANTIYFAGFPCSNSVTVVTAKSAFFLTDFRYLEKAEAEIKALEVRRMTQHGTDELAALLKSLAVRRIGFEGSVPYNEYAKLKKAAGRAKLEEAARLPLRLRAVKDEAEVELIAANQRTNEAIFKAALKAARAGVSEQELLRFVRTEMVRRGVEEAFDSIIASGRNSSLPHAVPTSRRVRAGEYLLFDMGVKAGYYHSDMTRTVVVGKASPRHREIYEIVLEAQERALAAIRPGAACRDVDARARDFIAQAGYGEYFGHGLGHGVGLQIHEGPTLNPRSGQVLEEGMVVTVEPGIYIPGFGGVRIEDLVVVTRDGYRNLTSVPKRFRSIVAMPDYRKLRVGGVWKAPIVQPGCRFWRGSRVKWLTSDKRQVQAVSIPRL